VHVPPRHGISRALLVAQIAVALLIARNWAYVTTYRLFLDHRIAAAGSAAAQQFDIEGTRVVPLIVTRGADRVAFATEIGKDSTIHAGVRPAGPATYAIEWQRGSSRRVLAQGTISEPTSVVCAYPGGTGVIEFVSDSPVTWVDPRVVRDLRVWPHVLVLAILGLCWFAWRRRVTGRGDAVPGQAIPVAAFRIAAAALGLVASLLASEAALRALGDMTPSGLATERHDLGEVTRDPRWIDSSRYGRRLRGNVDALNEWWYGDIVRMGYIPAPAMGGAPHRFTFHTDAEGFRNSSVRERFEVAALGDSFTDAMTMTVEASWPSRLERVLRVPVQNYGTAGFGPQQELLVLKDFVARRRPRVVVLAFFAGNDIFDAEAFEAFQRSGGTEQRVQQGWRIKDVVSRADTWFVVSALRAGTRWASSQETVGAATAASFSWGPLVRLRSADSTGSYREAKPQRVTPPSFDRGMFELPVAGRRLPFAFMPPYLNTLNFSEQELSARPGWRLTREAIAGMDTASRSFGAAFVVMFVPFKSQVYLPLLERAFTTQALQSSFRFYLDTYGRDVDVRRLYANRLAQNHLMREFCDRAGIPFVDTTAALERQVQSGENMYFPDESHLNEAGESVLADTLAAFLKSM
jgi:lysophospholipase L1-like esterase